MLKEGCKFDTRVDTALQIVYDRGRERVPSVV